MRRAACAGFSLLEVVVAFAILAVALTAFYRIFALAAHQASRAEDYAAAVTLAEARMAEAERSLASGHAGGETAEGFRWQRSIEPYGAFAARATDTGLAPLRIVVEVQWQRGGQRHAISLDTVRLGRAL
jgi:general secretion pathway protein I